MGGPIRPKPAKASIDSDITRPTKADSAAWSSALLLSWARRGVKARLTS